jgi:hypothetical protein
MFKRTIYWMMPLIIAVMIIGAITACEEPKEPAHTHDYGTAWKSNAAQHWRECSCGDKTDVANHTAGGWIVDRAATATTAGSRHKECTVCGYKTATETIPATGEGHIHNYGTEWKSNAAQHWRECSCGDKISIANHSAGDWIVDYAAAATTAGSKHKECTFCGYETETETIPATGEGHIHDYGTVWKSNAAQHWRECGCGDKTDVANHSGDPCTVCGYASGSQNPALCECNGIAEDCDCEDCDCEICETEGGPSSTLTGITLNSSSVKKNYNQNETLDLTGLVVTANYSDGTGATVTGYTSNPANGATLSTTGQITVTVTYTEGTVTKTASFIVNVNIHTHQWGDWTVSRAATETEDGEDAIICTTCGEVRETRVSYATGTPGLLFQLINGNTEYRVRRDPDSPVLSGEVYIPAYHQRPETGEYLLVREIGSTSDSSTWGAFYNTRITVINIPESVTVIGSYAFAISAGSTSYLTTVNIEEDSRLQRIGSYAFSDCNNLTGITIPAGVTTIGDSAFRNCSSLTGITIPEGVTAINNSAFSGCTNLTGIIIHEGITSIGGNAFSGCTSFTEITIPANVTSIASGAFSGCTNLTDIIIDNDKVTGNWGDRFPADNLSVTFKKNIGITAFYNCTRLTGVTLTEDVATIGTGAFTGCTGLTDIIIDTDKVTTTQTSNWQTIFPAGSYSVTFKKNVGNYAFYSSTWSLTSVTIAEGVTSIGNSAFYNCRSLTGITIPEGVTSIGNSAFYGCTSLTGITIPAGVTSIGQEAFRGCTGLIGITIPAGVMSIGSGAFSNCTYLRDIIIDTDKVTTNQTYNWGTIFPADNLSVTFKKNIGNYALYFSSYSNRLTGVTIEEGVTSIGSGAFQGCTSLTGITIPASVTSIGNDAFSGNYTSDYTFAMGLTSVTFTAGSQLETIGDRAFYLCTRLTDITIPASVTSIGNYAFSGTDVDVPPYTIPMGLTTVTFASGSQLQTIGERAFYQCTGLTSINIPASVTSIGAYAFYNTAWFNNKSDGIVYVNKVLYAYRGTMSANTVISGIQADTTAICGGAFSGCTGLTGITIPASVTEIGGDVSVYNNGAFSGCTNLTSITFAAGSQLQTIGGNAFQNCTSLTGITIPASVTSIGEYAFQGCTNLRNIIIDTDKVTTTQTYNWGTIFPANNLSVTFRKNVGNFAFHFSSSYTGLTSVTIAEGVTSIGGNAFYNCTGLTGITIPAGVTSIGAYAFSGCTSLTSITIPASVTTVGSTAFSSWTNSQTINVRGYASQAAADSAWRGSGWRNNCSAVIRYWNGSSYQ